MGPSSTGRKGTLFPGREDWTPTRQAPDGDTYAQPVIRRVALALVLALVACTARVAPLHGTVLEGKEAPDFTLTDGASGASVTLSSLRGRVVAMAFLYTRCPDICPLTAAKMRAAQRALGADASRLVLLAVSVDPEGDTPDAVRAFSAAHDLREGWHYLVAPRTQLERVWSLYGVGAFRAGSGPLVDHNDAIYLIDAQGREREIVHSDIALEDLVADLRALLR